MSSSMLEFAERCARQAGQLIAGQRHQLTIQFKGSAAEELVTQADIAADTLICDAIKEQFPEHQILSEELSPGNPTDVTHLWVIDPIDGTVNYAHQHSQVAISIAYFFQGQVSAAVVYNPFSDELFAAEQGQGATLNGQPIRCSDKTELKRALIATGFPYVKDELPLLMRRLNTVLANCADIRRLGSAALDICWVACGRLDGYYESVKPWDFAAAQLIATEAGARFGHIYVPDGNPQLEGDNLLISNPALFEPLRQLLLRADQLSL